MERVRPKFPTSFIDEHNVKRFEMDCQGTKTRLYIVVVSCLQLIAPRPKAWTFLKEHKYLRFPLVCSFHSLSSLEIPPSHYFPSLPPPPFPAQFPSLHLQHPPTVPHPHPLSPTARPPEEEQEMSASTHEGTPQRIDSHLWLGRSFLCLIKDASFVKKQELAVEPVAGER